jgi:L-alanine-DL-glutamate epimerase-like enolase superfamily enzyme
VRVYASGGYRYPSNDIAQLGDKVRAFADGFTRAKIKIGADDLSQDLRRIEIAAASLGGSDRLTVDAIYRYDLTSGIAAASACGVCDQVSCSLNDLPLLWREHSHWSSPNKRDRTCWLRSL